MYIQAMYLYLLLTVIVGDRCFRNVKCRADDDDDDQEDRRWNRLGEHLSLTARSGRNGNRRQREPSKNWRLSPSRLERLEGLPRLSIVVERSKWRREEIVGVVVASSGRARQVFWRRRDARRPSYSAASPHSLASSSDCAQPPSFITRWISRRNHNVRFLQSRRTKVYIFRVFFLCIVFIHVCSFYVCFSYI